MEVTLLLTKVVSYVLNRCRFRTVANVLCSNLVDLKVYLRGGECLYFCHTAHSPRISSPKHYLLRKVCSALLIHVYAMKLAQTFTLAASFGMALASPIVKRQSYLNDGE